MMTNLCNPDFFHGYLAWQEREDGIFLSRLPQAMTDWYTKESINWSKRGRCYAGIRLEMETDSSALHFQLKYLEGTREIGTFGVVIDGIVQPTVPLTPEDLVNPVVIPLDGKPHRVTVYLPNMISFVIQKAWAEGNAVPVPPRKKTYYSFGDSITQGMVGENPANAYPALVARHFDLELLNLGVGGINYNPGNLSDIETLPKPDLITIALGTNDWANPDDNTVLQENCRLSLKKISDCFQGVPTFVLLPIWRSDEGERTHRGTIQDIRNTIADIAALYPEMKCIDCQDMVPHDLAFYADGLHPNDKGFLHYGNNLIKQLERL